MLPGVTKRTYGKYEKNLSTLGKEITVFVKKKPSYRGLAVTKRVLTLSG
jgi:hypothetical protein